MGMEMQGPVTSLPLNWGLLECFLSGPHKVSSTDICWAGVQVYAHSQHHASPACAWCAVLRSDKL